ncbi:hypothetical protein PC118_g1488 [Phytophthora cactorum]|uniref:Uncharacterized protein n=2 Tax=Phytophthora cactorum TaxID=29920 RepID=A0A8T1GX83_9STRA|nr:hypothetical protein PC118_g1488 [Phytophthora cactorum]
MISGKKHSVPPSYRDQVERLFSKMMYVPTKEQFASRLSNFEQRLRSILPAIAKYFDRNWTSSCSMWINCGRRRCFSPGHTTTNRVEAGWYQLKQLHGKKTSIDRAQRDGGGDIESDGGLDHLEVEEDVIEVAEVEQLQPGSFERRGSSNVVPTDTLQCIAQEGTSDDLHLDINDDLDDCCVKNPTQVSMPDLDMSEQSQELLQRTFTTETGSRTDTDLGIEQEKTLGPKKILATSLDVLNLPRVNSALVEFARRRDTNNDYEKERKGGFSVNSV